MEEKILIKSEMDKKAKNTMMGIVIAFFVIAGFLFLFLCGKEEAYIGRHLYMRYWHAFHGNGLYLAFLIIACVALLFGIIALIVFLAYNKCELIVTEKNVKGKAIFGKEVVLPIYMVSAYSTKSFMSIISVSSSSGCAEFSFIKNYSEIGNVLSQLINKRQDQTQNVANEITAQKVETVQSTTNSNMDDLIKLKSLLDQGVITQEEFEAKKKQLLGL